MLSIQKRKGSLISIAEILRVAALQAGSRLGFDVLLSFGGLIERVAVLGGECGQSLCLLDVFLGWRCLFVTIVVIVITSPAPDFRRLPLPATQSNGS